MQGEDKRKSGEKERRKETGGRGDRRSYENRRRVRARRCMPRRRLLPPSSRFSTSHISNALEVSCIENDGLTLIYTAYAYAVRHVSSDIGTPAPSGHRRINELRGRLTVDALWMWITRWMAVTGRLGSKRWRQTTARTAMNTRPAETRPSVPMHSPVQSPESPTYAGGEYWPSFHR